MRTIDAMRRTIVYTMHFRIVLCTWLYWYLIYICLILFIHPFVYYYASRAWPGSKGKDNNRGEQIYYQSPISPGPVKLRLFCYANGTSYTRSKNRHDFWMRMHTEIVAHVKTKTWQANNFFSTTNLFHRRFYLRVSRPFHGIHGRCVAAPCVCTEAWTGPHKLSQYLCRECRDD